MAGEIIKDPAKRYSFNAGVNAYGEKYSDLFPSSSPAAGAGVTSPPPAKPVYRYTTDPTPLQKAQKEYYEGLDRTPAESEEDIRNRLIEGRKQELDAIDVVFNQKVQNILKKKEGALASVRSINTRGNLGGSDFVDPRNQQVEDLSQEQVDAVNAEKQLRISAVFDKVDQRAFQEAALQQETADKNSEKYLSYLATQADDAREDIKSLATAGMTLDQLDQADRENLLKQGNFNNEVELEAFFNNAKPKAEKIDYQYKIEGGKLFAYGVDPKTGTLKSMETDLGITVPKNSEIKELEGELWLVDKETGTAKKIAGERKKAAAPEAPSSYKEWSLAGGKAGTGKTYAEFLAGGGGSGNKNGSFFTTQEEERLDSTIGLDKGREIGQSILNGYSLDQIRSALKEDGDDPRILDTFDKVVGIEDFIKGRNQ